MTTWNMDLSNESNFVQQDSNKTDIAGSITLQPTGYDSYTKFLAHFDDLGHVITAAGNAKIVTSTSKFGNSCGSWSNAIGDKVTISGSASSLRFLHTLESAFTIDFWYKINSFAATNMFCDSAKATNANSGISLFIDTARKINFFIAGNGSAPSILDYLSTSTVPNDSNWHHLAIVYNGTNFTAYVDGVSMGTGSKLKASSVVSSTYDLQLGNCNGSSGNYFFNGYMDEFRVSNSARWGTTFTPPTQAYTVDGNTSLLLHMDGTNNSTVFTDSTTLYGTAFNDSATAKAITNTNSYITTWQSKFGGAAYFNGSTAYITTPNHADFSFGTGDFTVECWVYFSSVSGSDAMFLENYTAGTGWQLYRKGSTGKAAFWITALAVSSTTTINAGQWYHIAVARQGTALRMFVNGVFENVVSNSQNITTTQPLCMGRQNYNSLYYFNGYLDEVRVSKGIGRYGSSNFTPATQAFAKTAGFQQAYVTTSAASDFTAVSGNKIDTFTLTGSGSSNYITSLVSFDGRNTWKYWNVNQWSTVNRLSNLISTTNMQSKVDTTIGTSTSDQAAYPLIFRLPDNKYRIYSTYYNGYNQIVYRDTTDTNFPNSTNIGSKTIMISGTSTTNQVRAPHIIRKSDGTYRIYYWYYNGTPYIYYRDTTDTNLPNATNLGSATNIGVSGSSLDGPFVLPLSNGKYRMYYAQYDSGTPFWYIVYRDTTDTNLPNSTNLGSSVNIGLGTSASNQTISVQIVRMPNDKYRIYHGYMSSTYWTIAYCDTTDTNPPTTGNIGSRTILIGTGVSDSTSTCCVVKMDDGKYRIYYDYFNTYNKISYRDMADDWVQPIEQTQYTMSIAALNSALTGYVFQAGDTALDLAFNLGTDSNVTGSIDSVSMVYSSQNLPPIAPIISDVTKLNLRTTIQLPTFTDPDGDTLTYSVSGLPSGLTFDPATRKIHGVGNTTGQFSITMTANDNKGGSTNQGFLLTLNPIPKNTKIEDCFE